VKGKMPDIKKAIEISDAKIQFISLVDKAANKRQFLVTKAKDGGAQFSTLGKILKVDAEAHYITGVVYEPLVEDSHGNFMTEDEIKKAAHWFAKNGDKVDLQHSFEAVDGIAVVENYIAPCDMQIGDELVAKGTWLITAEVTNTDVWSAVQKGEITGFSMGGLGKYSEEDVPLDEIEKTTTDKKGLFKKLAGLFGLDVVEKGAMADAYRESMKGSSFWNAFYTLEDMLYRYNWVTDQYEFQSDETSIREALADFSAIITEILTSQNIAKALTVAAPVNKAGKKISSANMEKLDAAYNALTELRDKLADEEETENIEKEELDLKKEEVQAIVEESVAKALTPFVKALEAGAEPTGANSAQSGTQQEPTAEAVTKEEVAAMVEEGIAKALTPLLKARGIANYLNGEQQSIEKSGEQHFLTGIL